MDIWNDNQDAQQNGELAHRIKKLTTKQKTNKLRPTNILRYKVEKTTKNIHIKAMHILVMTTVFNVESTSSVYTARTVQQWDSDSGIIVIDNR